MMILGRRIDQFVGGGVDADRLVGVLGLAVRNVRPRLLQRRLRVFCTCIRFYKNILFRTTG